MNEGSETGTVGGPHKGPGPSAEKRERKSHVKKSTGGNANTEAAEAKRQNSMQKAAADRITNAQTEKANAEKRQLISTKLQTKEIVGRHPSEPIKHDEVEDAKVGRVALTGGEVPKVKTIDQKVDGEHVDTIVIVKDTGPTIVGGAHPLTEGQRVQAVIDENGDGIPD